MILLDLTLPTPPENLACDEALLDACDDGRGPEVLRLWEPTEYFVAVGYANKIDREVNVEACRKNRVPILRRCSGGGTVLQGPGCLNYALILRIDSHPALHTVTGTNRFVMERNRAALEPLLSGQIRHDDDPSSQSSIRHPASGIRHPASGIRHPASGIRHPVSNITVQGHTDLALDGRKFSGNAQRRRRNALLFHGTFLLNLDLALVSELLPMPSKQPAYRQERDHLSFLTNLSQSPETVRVALRKAWSAEETLTGYPDALTGRLATEKYSSEAWNRRC